MLSSEQMRYGAIVMAAMFGGPGVFYVLESFGDAGNALTGIIHLVFATALILAAQRRDAARARARPRPPTPPRKPEP